MGYVLIHRDGGEPGQRRVATALAALHAFVDSLRRDRRASVQDDAGQPVRLASLLAEAHWQLATPAGHRSVARIMADYVDVHVRGAAAPDGRVHRDWRQAGRAWAHDFENVPHPAVLDEVRRRHPDAPVDQLTSGAWAELPRHLALPTAWRGRWGVFDMTNGKVRMTYPVEEVARAHADVLNASRPWTDQERQQAFAAGMRRVQNQRAAAREQWASDPGSSSPAPAPQVRRRPRRQP